MAMNGTRKSCSRCTPHTSPRSSDGITRQLSKEALELAREQGAFTIFAVVDALTKIAGRLKNAGDRSEVDQKASSLLALAR